MAPKGNKHAVKLSTNELKLEAYKQYCAHIADGKSRKTWYFEHPDLTITFETMDSYIEQDPSVFPPITRKVAELKGYQYWESVVADSAKGKNKDANTASLQMLMRNKYRWDKDDDREKAPCASDKILDAINTPPKT